MKKLVKATMLAAVSAVALSGAAFAGSKDVVKDERDNVVMNTFGNCVRTKWDSKYDECTAHESRTVYFDFNSSRLTPAAKAKLDSLVDIIKNSATVDNVSIVGFADMIGSSEYNYALAKRRAKSVENYMVSKGYISIQDTEVRSFGEDAPVSNCEGVTGNELRACLWRDRRAEIRLNVK
ncbi:MAG: OmpA family protein [Rickettsiales bacterium]|nr:OmpA family protein [Rickettsiales bacterium]